MHQGCVFGAWKTSCIAYSQWYPLQTLCVGSGEVNNWCCEWVADQTGCFVLDGVEPLEGFH